MNESICPYTCLIKEDLQNTADPMLFLKENWLDYSDMEAIFRLSRQELTCSMCLLDIVLSKEKKKRTYPKKKIEELRATRKFLPTLQHFLFEVWNKERMK